MLPVAVDAMGGDDLDAVVAGAKRAATELGVPVVLVGDPSTFDPGDLDVLPASEVITMHDDPASAVRQKKDASLNVAARAVRDGLASAMVSAGNTGALMAMSKFCLRTMASIDRPAIAALWPTVRDASFRSSRLP